MQTVNFLVSKSAAIYLYKSCNLRPKIGLHFTLSVNKLILTPNVISKSKAYKTK